MQSAPPGVGASWRQPRMLDIKVWLHVTGRRIWAPWGRADTARVPGRRGRRRAGPGPEGGLARSGTLPGGRGRGPRADPPPSPQYGIKKKEEREAEAQAALEANSEGSLTRPKKAIPPGCGDAAEEEDESILDTVIKYLPGPLQDIFKK